MNEDLYTRFTSDQSGQSAPPAAESFGDFGPLPEMEQPVSQPTLFQPGPTAPPPVPINQYPPQSGQPPQYYPYPPQSGQPPQYYPYPPGLGPTGSSVPGPVYAPAFRVKAPLHFPLFRQAPAYIQIFEMVFYIVFMAVAIMGIVLSLYHNYQSGVGVLANPDGTANDQAILLVIILVLLVVPACSLLAGAIFGSWRGLIVSLCSLAGGLLISHISNPVFWNTSAIQGYLFLAPFPLAALVVGWVYERRKYAAWWRSMFIMMLGAGIISLCLAILVMVVDFNSPTIMQDLSTSTNPQAFMVGVWVAGGCIFIGLIPLLAFPIACIEGIIHASITVASKQ
jgi:hypothetical protein